MEDEYVIPHMDAAGDSGDWTKARRWDIFFNDREDIVEQFIRIMCPTDRSPEHVRLVMDGWVKFMPSAKVAPDDLIAGLLRKGLIDRDPRL